MSETTKRNPAWTRDELILALDFYMRYSPSIPEKTSNEIVEFSLLLNNLAGQISDYKNEKFRNANGVYMKLMNFRRFDPNVTGKGLQRGGKDEEVVWNLYSNNSHELSKAANAIRNFVSVETGENTFNSDDDFQEANEGRILTRVHKSRERNRKLVEKIKVSFLERHGNLFCEACGFNFEEHYGPRGNGYIECHHTKPVSELQPNQKTNIKDLVLLCSNCHRMVHRTRPWLSVDELKELLR